MSAVSVNITAPHNYKKNAVWETVYAEERVHEIKFLSVGMELENEKTKTRHHFCI